ncbi:MAG: EipA family protein, partial [Bradyrhizobium sp.]
MIFASRLAAVTLAALMCWTLPASAQQVQVQPLPPQQAQPQPLPPPQQQGPATFGPDELVNAGHKFFGNVSRGLASIIERAVSQWGLPNGYVLGEEGSGAFVAGLRYGEGTLYTKNAGDLRVYW